MKRKVLFISNWSFGLYLFRRELIEKISKDNEVYIIANDNGFIDNLKELGCKYIPSTIDSHGVNPILEIKQIIFYKKKIKEIKPDIVFTYTIKPNVYAGIACSSLGIPYVANITGLGSFVEKSNLSQIISIVLYKYGLRKAKKVFFQNKENQDFMLKKKVVRCPYDLIPGSGVNLERFRLLDYPDSEIINFVFIARIIKEKGIDQYLDAARYFSKTHHKTKFHVCGYCEDDYKKTIQDEVLDGNIIYHGRINDILMIHKISSCTVHPSYYPEGMSNVLLESAACGRPIITTDRSGCREIVDDGINGLVVRQKDSKDLIAKIEKFLSLDWEQRRNMGLAGRKKVEREFDRNIVLNMYLNELSNIS